MYATNRDDELDELDELDDELQQVILGAVFFLE